MEKLNTMLMDFEADSYKGFIETLSTNTPNSKKGIMHDSGKTYIEMSSKTQRKALIFPKYEHIENLMPVLKDKRDKLFVKYRLLRNKILFDTHSPKSHEFEYNDVVGKIQQIDNEIDTLESYIRVQANHLNTKSQSYQDTIKDLKAKTLQDITPRERMLLYSKIHELQHEKQQHSNKVVNDFYIVKQPSEVLLEKREDQEPKKKKGRPKKVVNVDVDEAPKEKKKRGRPKKVVGGAYFIDNTKVKDLVKSQLQKFYLTKKGLKKN